MIINRDYFLGLSALLLSACSAPTPPAISGKAEPINQQTSITPLEPVVVTVMQSKPITRHYRLYYPYNIATTSRDPLLQNTILPAAKTADRIRILGRTDGRFPPSQQDQWIAERRAINVRNYLVARGVPAERIDVNYAAATDYIADNTTSSGRQSNRRVDIEIIWEPSA
ncbi:OmpA family protein (plasmid) [Plesiomonas shigelloides]|uniref:OmpA family protein n=1 Tax=Plesiomonas shigelloides TaxID=703 RepID=UPI0017872E2E|nr:OmpA family protein [Plesiomonas shigelloides]QOH81530.1 OmpA family protein [Plesiomonas shigelloides]